MLLGLTLATRPEEIYRALIESTAYGTRIIIDDFEANGIPVKEIVAAGGLPERNKLLMQIYADVTGRPIRQTGTSQGGAVGSAMHATVLVLAVFFFMRRFRPGAELDTALVTVSCFGVIGFARGASTDMLLAARRRCDWPLRSRA